MRVIFIGDVVGSAGREALAAVLPSIRRDYNVDLAIVNGENSADGNGIDARSAQAIYDAGADHNGKSLVPQKFDIGRVRAARYAAPSRKFRRLCPW